MTLRLTNSDQTTKPCPTCNGVGSVVMPDSYGVRSSQWVRNGRAPCPTCDARTGGGEQHAR